jgi:hypothetical protein|tara:strand:+ start:2013 stop:2207 length:195 start_codon:yes stop_codon:yes gene_type:complete
MKLMNMIDIKPIDRDEFIWSKEDEFFKLLGITDKKQSEQIRGLFNEIVQHLVVRTDNIFSEEVK